LLDRVRGIRRNTSSSSLNRTIDRRPIARGTTRPSAISRAHNPHRFHEERSDIAHDLAELARRVAPRSRRAKAVEVDISEGRRGRIVVATQTINGKRVMVQSRKAFAVYVGERSVKPD
jgi:hypothetical protein